MLHLFDTALGRVAPIEPRHPGRLSVYVCGPTVSGEPHVGHGRFNLVWDVIRRYAIWTGFDVHYVSNITDIDDKIINRANLEGSTTEAVAETYERVWWETMDRLGIARPSEDPHATMYVEEMLVLIGSLIERGKAYVGGDGVYFSAETVDDYGLLARQSIDSLRAGARLEVSDEAGKRAPIDFVLWKFAKPDEPAWDSPWGPGRPGWHTECVVMSLDLLGEGFDLHGGGNDLAFPHHENERAQAVADGKQFARHWVHSGMVVADGGEKMSKSLGNTLSLPQILDAYDPRAYRLLVLQAHYRSPLSVTAETLSAAERTLVGLDRFASDFVGARGATLDEATLVAFAERMDDDLDTPNAVGALFALQKEARSATGERAASLAATVLGLFEGALGLELGGVEDVVVSDEAVALAVERDEARQARDFARADELRSRLQALGYTAEDGPDGTVLRRVSEPDSEFALDTAVTRRTEGGWDAEITTRWNIGANPNGGYLLALAGRAMREQSGRPDPISMSATYLSPPTAGPARVEAATVKSGRSFATVEASLIQEGTTRLRVLGTFGDLSAQSGPTRVDGGPPDLPPPDECVGLTDNPARRGFPLADRLDVRLDPDSPWLRPSEAEHFELDGWIRLRDGGQPDVLSLLTFCDAYPPALMSALDVRWVPTITLNVLIRARPEPGWVRGSFRTRFLIDGLFEEDGELWDAAGRPVVQSRQIALVLQPR